MTLRKPDFRGLLSLADLPGTGQQHDRELVRGANHDGFEGAVDLHGAFPNTDRLIGSRVAY